MNVAQNLPSAFPFFNALHKQTARHSYCRGMEDLIAIECRLDRLLPFVIKQTPATAATDVYLVKQNGLSAIVITSLLTTLQEDTLNGVGYTYFWGNADINQATTVNLLSRSSVDSAWGLAGDSSWGSFACDGGLYYIEIEIGTSTYQSELIRLSDFPEFASEGESDNSYTRTRIVALSNCEVAGVPTTQLNLEQKLFVNARAFPEYEEEREVATDGEDEESTLWAKITKRYTLRFYATETVADFCKTLPLYSTVNISDQYGVATNVYNIEVEVTWPEEGNYCAALVEMKFQRDFASNSECC